MSVPATLRDVHERISGALAADFTPREAALAIKASCASATDGGGGGGDSASSPSPSMSSSVVDALWLADCEISAMEEDGEGTAEDSNSNEGASGHVPSQSAAQARQASAKAKAPRLARLVMELVRCSAIDKNACPRASPRASCWQWPCGRC